MLHHNCYNALNLLNNHTCTTDTKEIEDPISAGGLDRSALGFAEYAEGEADNTFITCTIQYIMIIVMPLNVRIQPTIEMTSNIDLSPNED